MSVGVRARVGVSEGESGRECGGCECWCGESLVLDIVATTAQPCAQSPTGPFEVHLLTAFRSSARDSGENDDPTEVVVESFFLLSPCMRMRMFLNLKINEADTN